MGKASRINLEKHNSSFPSKLRDLLSERHVTQQELADICDVTRQSISQWQNGFTSPDIAALRKIAEYFHVSTDYLLGLTDAPTRDTSLGAVCDYTGLTQSACEYLHRCQDFSKLPDWPEAKEFLNTVNLLLEDARYQNTEEEFRRPILGLISFFFRYADTTHERAVIYDDGKILKGKAKPDSRLVSALSIDETLVENALLLELQQALKSLKQVLLERSAKENG